MNERLVLIRKKLGMNQKEFAESLAIGQSTLAMIEVGKRALNDRHIKLICSVYNINENWLRTGEGEMMNTLTRSQIITDFLADILKDEEDSFRRRLIEALSTLDVNDWEVLEKIANSLQKKD